MPSLPSTPSTQKTVLLPAKRTPYIQGTVPVEQPGPGEIVVKVLWTSSSPVDLHQADGGLLIQKYPFRTGGGGAAGPVVAIGPPTEDGGEDSLKGLRVGDLVTSLAWRHGREANHSEYITIPAYIASKVPAGMDLRSAVTVPVNLVTVFHATSEDLHLPLPWPIPAGWTPPQADAPVLIWGASSSVGIFALQVYRHWGYTNLVAAASGKHHEYLRRIGASACFDYTKPGVVETILAHNQGATAAGKPQYPYILDCIGSVSGTLVPLSKIAQAGSRVAIMMPLIVRDATDDEEPEYFMGDVRDALPEGSEWDSGAVVRGVRTHFYLKNEFYKQHLQPEIVPALLEQGVVEPNNYRIVEGATLVERAQKALDLLRQRAVSGERLVWRVAEED